MRGGDAGAALTVVVLVFLGGCSQVIPGSATGAPPGTETFAGKPGANPQLASTGPRITTLKKVDRVAPCAIANQNQVSAALGPVTGTPAPLSGNPSSCVWPLGSGNQNGFLVGYGIDYEGVTQAHPAGGGAIERTTDGNSTWLWCDVSPETGAFACGAAIAVTADRTFVTGLVRSPGPGRTKTSVLTELQPITIALFRSLPG